MKTYIYIEGDTNDADMISSLSEIDADTLALITPLIQAIKERKTGYNFPTGDMSDLNDISNEEYYEPIVGIDALDAFYDYVPHGEHGIHSIDEIRILTVTNDVRIL